AFNNILKKSSDEKEKSGKNLILLSFICFLSFNFVLNILFYYFIDEIEDSFNLPLTCNTYSSLCVYSALYAKFLITFYLFFFILNSNRNDEISPSEIWEDIFKTNHKKNFDKFFSLFYAFFLISIISLFFSFFSVLFLAYFNSLPGFYILFIPILQIFPLLTTLLFRILSIDNAIEKSQMLILIFLGINDSSKIHDLSFLNVFFVFIYFMSLSYLLKIPYWTREIELYIEIYSSAKNK
ncbi:MAG: hypothetical protein ACK5XN_29280, partial [Bacteroidota bacterium]